MKTLLLFFDGIGLLVPEYLLDKPAAMAPETALPLQEQGLLHLITPETFIDLASAEQLAAQMGDIIHSGLLDQLDAKRGAFHELSMSRLGYSADARLANMLFEELKARGLALDSADGVSIPMHYQVRYLILVLLAQILRTKGGDIGLNLAPATDRPELVRALTELLEHPDTPSAGHVVATDMTTVGVDLSTVPLDEVLSFRTLHRKEHRAYAVAVREFVRDLSQLSEPDRVGALAQRKTELRDLAAGLQRRHTQAWHKPLSYALGAAGAVWRMKSGDTFGALLAAGALLAGIDRKQSETGGAFSYVFSARERLRYG